MRQRFLTQLYAAYFSLLFEGGIKHAARPIVRAGRRGALSVRWHAGVRTQSRLSRGAAFLLPRMLTLNVTKPLNFDDLKQRLSASWVTVNDKKVCAQSSRCRVVQGAPELRCERH